MPANPSLKSLWHSLNFTARLAALTTLLVALTIPLSAIKIHDPVEIQSSASEPTVIPARPLPLPTTCLPRPPCLDATPRCLIAEPADGWCRISPKPSFMPLPTLPPQPITRPLIRISNLPQARQNQPYQAPVTGQESGSTTLTLTTANLPNGLSLTRCQSGGTQNASAISCALSGRIHDAAGSYPITFTLSDSSGNSTVKTVNLTVIDSSWFRRLFPN